MKLPSSPLLFKPLTPPLSLSTRHISLSKRPTLPPTPQFSSPDTAIPVPTKKELSEILSRGGKGKWTLSPDGKGVERRFKFESFRNTWEFMDKVAAECKVVKHHPEWSNSYNTTFIRWTTHNPPGISPLDIQMARFCDMRARISEEIEEESLP